jgi:hypothetical protein
VSLDERPRVSTRPTPMVHYNSLPRTSIDGALEKLLSNLQMIDTFRQLVPYAQALSRSVATETYFIGHHQGSLRAWEEAGEVGRPPAWPERDAEKPEGAEEDPAVGRDLEDLDWKLDKYGELLPEIMGRMERELAGDALTLWSGFAAFCAKSMGVAAEKILVATLQEGPGEETVGRVEGLKDRAERLGLELDEESVEEICESLAEAWRVVEERGA